jgi:hypothetical protein
VALATRSTNDTSRTTYAFISIVLWSHCYSFIKYGIVLDAYDKLTTRMDNEGLVDVAAMAPANGDGGAALPLVPAGGIIDNRLAILESD